MFRGIGLKVAATLAFALMSAIIKAGSETFPASELVFFRSLFALATLAAWLRLRANFPPPSTRRPFGHIVRSLSGTCGMFANFTALSLLPLVDASIIAAFDYVAMIWAATLGYAVFGEAPSPRILIATGVAALWRAHAARRIARVGAAETPWARPLNRPIRRPF